MKIHYDSEKVTNGRGHIGTGGCLGMQAGEDTDEFFQAWLSLPPEQRPNFIQYNTMSKSDLQASKAQHSKEQIKLVMDQKKSYEIFETKCRTNPAYKLSVENGTAPLPQKVEEFSIKFDKKGQGKNKLDREDSQNLQALADFINENCPDAKILIEGRSASSGNSTKDKSIALSRAENAEDVLEGLGLGDNIAGFISTGSDKVITGSSKKSSSNNEVRITVVMPAGQQVPEELQKFVAKDLTVSGKEEQQQYTTSVSSFKTNNTSSSEGKFTSSITIPAGGRSNADQNVAKLQQALRDLGYPMPKSFSDKGQGTGADGWTIVGGETHKTVEKALEKELGKELNGMEISVDDLNALYEKAQTKVALQAARSSQKTN